MDLWIAGWICVGIGLFGVFISIMGILTSRRRFRKKKKDFLKKLENESNL